MEVGLGSLMGFGAASSLAKMYSILAYGGTIGGKPLLPKSMVDAFSIAITQSLPMDIKLPNLVFSRGFQVTKNVQVSGIFSTIWLHAFCVGIPQWGTAHAEIKNHPGVEPRDVEGSLLSLE